MPTASNPLTRREPAASLGESADRTRLNRVFVCLDVCVLN